MKHAQYWKTKENAWKRQEFLGVIPNNDFLPKKIRKKKTALNLNFELDESISSKRSSFKTKKNGSRTTKENAKSQNRSKFSQNGDQKNSINMSFKSK